MDQAKSDELCLEATSLTKDFGSNRGIFDVSLNVKKGEVVGFVGPNGAGKSTTINVLTGLVKPGNGSFKIFNKSVDYTNIYSLMPRIGVLFSEQTIEDDLTAEGVFKRSEELLRRNCKEQWQKMSDELELDTNKKVKKLSLGNKKKVAVVNALMHSPELLIMDEPTSGLDPLIRSRFMTMISSFTAGGGSVLLSSHDLGEVQQICHRIIMIKAGKVILSDTTENILSQAVRSFRLINPSAELVNNIKVIIKPESIKTEGNEVVLQVKNYESLLELLTKFNFYNFFIERPSLETAFKEKYN